jgi:hypothetical protein
MIDPEKTSQPFPEFLPEVTQQIGGAKADCRIEVLK